MKRYNRLREITIKKTGIFLIETPIFRLNTAKTGLLESYNQKICGFIDRNPGRELYPETALTGHSSPEKPCYKDYRYTCIHFKAKQKRLPHDEEASFCVFRVDYSAFLASTFLVTSYMIGVAMKIEA